MVLKRSFLLFVNSPNGTHQQADVWMVDHSGRSSLHSSFQRDTRQLWAKTTATSMCCSNCNTRLHSVYRYFPSSPYTTLSAEMKILIFFQKKVFPHKNACVLFVQKHRRRKLVHHERVLGRECLLWNKQTKDLSPSYTIKYMRDILEWEQGCLGC